MTTREDAMTTREDAMTTRHIDALESFDINGGKQWVLLRGNLAAGRVLLVVQQGPGFPLIQDARAFEQSLHLEAEAVVAYWDQRGTGKSFRADPSTLTVAQSAADVRAVIDALCARFGVERVDVLGLSIGGSFAIMAAARDLARIGHLVAVGVDVDFVESERWAYAFARAEAARRGARRALRQLDAIGAPPHDTAKKFMTRARWVAAFGGINRRRGYFGLTWDTASRVLRSPHYALGERLPILAAIEKTLGLMITPSNHFDLRTAVPRLQVPIAFFQGRKDVGTNPELVARYAAALDAPFGKSIVWFEESAHMPYYEEPTLFRAALLRALDLPGAASPPLDAGVAEPARRPVEVV
jgi:pimeloyl-ACP methyl ester carboxylesterase